MFKETTLAPKKSQRHGQESAKGLKKINQFQGVNSQQRLSGPSTVNLSDYTRQLENEAPAFTPREYKLD